MARFGLYTLLDEMRSGKRIIGVSYLNNLDDSLLAEILIRLPSSKAANRLKLVCKRWYSLISTDYFVRVFIYRRHDQSLPPIPCDDDYSYSLVCQYVKVAIDVVERSCLIDFQSNGKFITNHSLDLSFLPSSPLERILVKAACKDLLLCCFYPEPKSMLTQTTRFYVVNPLTKQWVALPTPTYKDPNLDDLASGFLCIPAPCSLCRHPTKVAQIRDNCEINYPLSELTFELYSSEQGGWRSYVVPYPLEFFRGGPTTLVPYRGKLHWLVNHCILVYDPFNAPERFSRIIDLPPHQSDYAMYSFYVCQGRLRVAMGDSAFEVYIWELEDYDTGKWSLVHERHEWRRGEDTLRFYVHIDGNYVHTPGRTCSLFLCNTRSGASHLLHQDTTLHILYRYNVRQIANQCWPTPVPSPSLNM